MQMSSNPTTQEFTEGLEFTFWLHSTEGKKTGER
jgi:hypothetical protein